MNCVERDDQRSIDPHPPARGAGNRPCGGRRGAQQSLDAARQLKTALEEKGDAVRELATYYLPEINRERVDATFGEIRGELATVVDRKDRARTELAGRRDRFEQSLQTMQTQLEDVSRQFEDLTRRMAETEQEIARSLAANAEFQQLSQQALAAEHELQQNEERAEQIQREAAAKLPAYRDSRLFQYLYAGGFGTAAYQRRGLVRTFDRWVAELIDFRRARRSYEFLQTTPELVSREMTRRRGGIRRPDAANRSDRTQGPR